MRDLLAATTTATADRIHVVANRHRFRNSREVSQFCHCSVGPERFELRPSCQFRTPSFPRPVCDRKSQGERVSSLLSREMRCISDGGEIIRDCPSHTSILRACGFILDGLKCGVKRRLNWVIRSIFPIDFFYIKLLNY